MSVAKQHSDIEFKEERSMVAGFCVMKRRIADFGYTWQYPWGDKDRINSSGAHRMCSEGWVLRKTIHKGVCEIVSSNERQYPRFFVFESFVEITTKDNVVFLR